VYQQNDQDMDLWLGVISSEIYQVATPLLFDLFCASRQMQKDPQAILDFQRLVCRLLLRFQQMKADREQAGDLVGLTTAKRLILLVKQIMDSLVWRVLDYRRIDIQLLAEHNQTGHLDQTAESDLALAQQTVDEESAIVLVNDFTNLLRYGDLTVIRGDQYEGKENKSSKSGKKSGRAKRQRDQLEEILRFLRTGTRLTKEGEREYIFKAPVPMRAYLSNIAELIDQAKQAENGYSQKQLSDAVAVEAYWSQAPIALSQRSFPFDAELLLPPIPFIWFSNVTILDQPIRRCAPYGVFPFDDRTCFELMTGEVILNAVLHLGHLRRHYQQYGLTLRPAPISQEDVNEYRAASIGEQMQLLSRYHVEIGDDHCAIPFSFAHFCPLFIEFFQEEPFVVADRQMFTFLREFLPAGRAAVNIDYTGEPEIWH
jgi:hypothetical protein